MKMQQNLGHFGAKRVEVQSFFIRSSLCDRKLKKNLYAYHVSLINNNPVTTLCCDNITRRLQVM